MLGPVTDKASDSLADFVAARPAAVGDEEALGLARQEAEELGLALPDEQTGRLLATLAAAGSHPDSSGAIAVTPAAGVVSLYLLRGLAEGLTVTGIDPEAEHKRQAALALKRAGYRPGAGRFLTSQPLDVLGRMAEGSYQLVYLDVDPRDASALLAAAWPLLSPGGSLVVADLLLDGTVAQASRTDRVTAAARAAIEEAEELGRATGDGPAPAVVTHLPLGAGMTVVTRR
ncbi:O-methyltransferase [Corynebacterium otitidis]|uniref:Putative methyltransferase n=1 Tax=Corynebacterium otitidis ATCC 51513 TaxID=883169 RepID=I7JVW1_9CORY|nr:class I SAM-dependent methyltransferase [Corynebacterium otitidis]EJZ82084.1 hypothetical protein HMPREF9719_00966 [Corynebacterium otitidis ATCC 51513]KKO84059.1 methyltransferase [Corynebacterium otitidis]CCI83311.1 putative methyltransferase [Corynebacterium otitidis ATCC 51513]